VTRADDPDRNAEGDAFEIEDDVTSDYVVSFEVERPLISNRCVLGERCCCPHIFHTEDECYSAEDAERWDLGGES
jgi:hypothetical protein